LQSRRFSALKAEELKPLGVVMKRAKYFITCKGKRVELLFSETRLLRNQLVAAEPLKLTQPASQLTFFDINPGLWPITAATVAEKNSDRRVNNISMGTMADILGGISISRSGGVST
jgi:hypothetical protein